ncbi:acetylglutamate kinase [Heterostelium album PN500]|uniref:Acetylglutamate kinase n=1 Tax=Heterostelium pallidum (strain ATCC 26659 / Pp 5 / PN500) TaxID=670386 RepID=D3BPT3_HETP5|nr:acetylglutamate kinase [Heterostelium album PN500]EFA76216.1 acetylglutamate kinase [Heterostelium album PN500]|eukprot:XP_020428349.1 acetylglutamate kinase [Heterostelium album PN500]
MLFNNNHNNKNRRKVNFNFQLHSCTLFHSVQSGGYLTAARYTSVCYNSSIKGTNSSNSRKHFEKDYPIGSSSGLTDSLLLNLLLYMMTTVFHSPKQPNSSNHSNHNPNNHNTNHNNNNSSSSNNSNINNHSPHNGGKNHHYPQISQFKAGQHILQSARHKQLHPNSSTHSVSSHHPNQVEPDDDAINILTFSGIFYKFLIFIISFLPFFLIEKLLTLFAWIQLELLKAKGRSINPEQTYSKLKKKRKLKKKKHSKSLSINGVSSKNNSPSLPSIKSSSTEDLTQLQKKEENKNNNNNDGASSSSSLTQLEEEFDKIKEEKDDGQGTLPSPSSMPILQLTPSSPTPDTFASGEAHLHNTSTPDTDMKLAVPKALNRVHTSSENLVDNPEQLLKHHHLAKWEQQNHSLALSAGNLLTVPSSGQLNRPRSDSVCGFTSDPCQAQRSISEIRRVNSEAALYQTSEDQMLFEANLQSRREFEDFLRSVKDIKDVRNWLQNFSGSAPRKIAIVKISRRILETQYGIDQAAASLCFMYKFGLLPIVIHGGLNDIARLPCTQVIEERRDRSAKLKEAIKKNGVGSSVLTPDICEIEPIIEQTDNDTLSEEELEFGKTGTVPNGGLTMKIDSFDYDLLTQALEKGKIPIWDSVAETTDGLEIPINSDVTTFELAKRIQPYKIIFACNDGGILDFDHKAIPTVYLDEDYHRLMEAEHTTDRRRVQLKQMKRIVDNLPASTTLVVTSIENITHQLLFPRLANGTVIKKCQDNKVLVFDAKTLNQVDMPRLRILIEDSFGRALSEDYFDYLNENLYKLYLCVSADGQYNGCAIVTFKKPDYIPYLCKFCVQKSAQGLGLGDLIWRILQRDIDKLYWRSRNNNPLNPWYFQRCQGSFRADEHFTVFWYGDDKFEDGSMMIEEALRKPITVLPIASKS